MFLSNGSNKGTSPLNGIRRLFTKLITPWKKKNKLQPKPNNAAMNNTLKCLIESLISFLCLKIKRNAK